MTSFVRAMILAALVAPVGGAAAQPTNPNDHSANAVYAGCKAFASGQKVAEPQMAMIGNYCAGMLHALTGITEYLTGGWHSCIPNSSNAAQSARVVVKFLDEHPERMHEDFRALALEAFHQAWPCR